VEEKLQRRWSPQQIAGWLKVSYPKDPQMQVSHESIYRTLYVQARELHPPTPAFSEQPGKPSNEPLFRAPRIRRNGSPQP